MTYRGRKGFTLVELLVAMGLTVLIMAILAGAFSAALATLSQLKALGDLSAKLRTATSIISRDLAADHFDGHRRLSDPNFWANGPPTEGFFRVFHGNPSYYEGVDLDGLPSFRSNITSNHSLSFTVKLRGNQRTNLFQANVPGGSPLLLGFTNSPLQPDARFQDSGFYSYEWAEVAYYLQVQSGDSADPTNNNGTPLCALYRRQRVAVQDDLSLNGNAAGNAVTSTKGYDDVSCFPFTSNGNTYAYFNGPGDLTVPDWRLGGNNSSYSPLTSNGIPNADLLLNDVISFDVRLLLQGASDVTDLFNNQDASGVLGTPYTVRDSNGSQITDYANLTNSLFNYGGTSAPRVFDTWSSFKQDAIAQTMPVAMNLPGIDYSAWNTTGTNQTIPLYKNAAGQPIRIRAIQIILRVWEPKTQQTRQVTIVQDL